MERNYFYILEIAYDGIDIREQYHLLPIEDALEITNELGIEYPRQPQTKELIVISTYFLITYKRNSAPKNFVRRVKTKEQLLNKRGIEKFEIERIYWG